MVAVIGSRRGAALAVGGSRRPVAAAPRTAGKLIMASAPLTTAARLVTVVVLTMSGNGMFPLPQHTRHFEALVSERTGRTRLRASGVH